MISFVYFIKPVGQDGPVKIGHSQAPENRLMALAAWSPWPLEIVAHAPGTMKDEQFTHQRFADCHSHHEWFRSTPELRAAIKAIAESGSLDCIRSLPSKGAIRSPHKKNYSEDRRRYLSYAARIRGAQKKLRKLGDDTAFCTPNDVCAILERWDGRERQQPSADEIARLDQYLADPAAHSVLWAYRPRLVA